MSNFILQSTSVIYLEKENEWRNRFYPGEWIRIFPLVGILELESDEPIDVPGFRRFPWGEEYAVFMLPGVVKHGDIVRYANAVADLRRLQDPRIQEIVYRTQKAIEILTAGMIGEIT